MHRFLRVSALLIAGLLTSHVVGHSARSDLVSDKTLDRTQFIEVTRIAQLPADEQEKAVPQLYRLLGEISRDRPKIAASVLYTSLPWRTPDHEKLSPQAQADLAERQGNTRYFADESGQLSCRTLRKYPAQTAALLRADLRAADVTLQLRGLSNLAALKTGFGLLYDDGSLEKENGSNLYASLYPEIARIFQSAPPAPPANEFGLVALGGDLRAQRELKTEAEYALLKLGDARAIPLLIEDDAARPMLHYDAILILARQNLGAPELQSLVPLLRYPDAKVRAQATFALSGATTVSVPGVAAALPNLLDDADVQVRELAIRLAAHLKGENFGAVRAPLRARLDDTVPKVRFAAAKTLAEHDDPSAAPVLLAFLKAGDAKSSKSETRRILLTLIGNVGRYWGIRGHTGYKEYLAPGDKTQSDAEDVRLVEAWIAAHPVQ